jgi:hypothetical protein
MYSSNHFSLGLIDPFKFKTSRHPAPTYRGTIPNKIQKLESLPFFAFVAFSGVNAVIIILGKKNVDFGENLSDDYIVCLNGCNLCKK